MSASQPQAGTRTASLRLSRIEIENYKSLDRLALELPTPRTPDELDAFVLGSKNGVGKSSLLECCALSVLGAVYPGHLRGPPRAHEMPDVFELLIRSGASKALISVDVALSGDRHKAQLQIGAQKGFRPDAPSKLRELADPSWTHHVAFEAGGLLDSLLGLNSEPLVLPPILLFHSYRKIQEGNPELGLMADPDIARRRYRRGYRGGGGALSIFKSVLVQALMERSGLFEGVSARGNNEGSLSKLNGLLKEFAGGTVDKLRPRPDGTLEIRVTPTGGGDSFSFDGLSSGQKEIIATLFLIWYATRDRPSIVLIDEPELHLNAEWQRIFLHQLGLMAPANQYILATHSEEVFRSVPQDQRLLLQAE